MKSIFFSKRSPLFQFEIAFSDMLIFLTPKEVGETSVFVEKNLVLKKFILECIGKVPLNCKEQQI